VRRFYALALALILALGLASCGAGGEDPQINGYTEYEPDPEYPVVVGFNRARVEFRPTRVVSLHPSLTEKIHDLGHGGKLVGISDHQSDYPPSLVHLPRYGVAKMPYTQGLLRLNPHIVFSVEELPHGDMIALEYAGITLVILPFANSMAELEEVYLGLSTALDGLTSGQLIGELFLRERLRRPIDEIAASTAGYLPLNAMYLRHLDNVATGDTLEGELLELIGFVNIARDQRGGEFDPEYSNIPVAELDVIFFNPEHVDPESFNQSGFLQGIAATPIHVDSIIFEHQSLRLLGQLEIMAQAMRAWHNPTDEDDH